MELEIFEITGVTPVVQNPSAALYCLPKQLMELHHCKIETCMPQSQLHGLMKKSLFKVYVLLNSV